MDNQKSNGAPGERKVIAFPGPFPSDTGEVEAQQGEVLCEAKDSTATTAQATESAEVTESVTSYEKGQQAPNYGITTKREAERVVFVEWLSLGDVERRERGLPTTQRELAKRLNVSEYTLSHWKSEPEIHKALARRLRGRALEHAPAILDKVAEKAKADAELGAAKMVFDIAMPKEGPDVAVGFFGMKPEEILRSDLEKPGELPDWARADVMEGEVVEPKE